MKNPFGDQQLPGSYDNLEERLYKKVSVQVKDKLAALLQKAYENALNEEHIVLSRVERNRLFSQIINRLMEDMLKRPGNNSSAD